MHLCKLAMGASSTLGMRIALSTLPAVAITRASSGKLFTKIPAFHSKSSVISDWSWRLRFFPQQFSATLKRPAAAPESAWGFRAGNALGLGVAIGGIGYICGGDSQGGATTALTAAALLSLSILVHEAGHLVAAKALDVSVREFSVGIGPRVAWWQGPSTTYCLRAFPLLGFVSFSTHVDSQVGGKSYSAPGVHKGNTPPRLLTSVSPARRAVVMASGVAANVLLATAFICWQVLAYGEAGKILRPGARVDSVGGWDGDNEETAAAAVAAAAAAEVVEVEVEGGQQRQLRLQKGDVILSVGKQRLPAGGVMNAALVSALDAAAIELPLPSHAEDGEAGGSGCETLALHGAIRSLDGVKMSVLRTHFDGANDSSVPERVVLQMDAADVLRYENLSVTHNLRLGYRKPLDVSEMLQMTWTELIRYTRTVVVGLNDWLAAAINSSINGSSSSTSYGSSNPDSDRIVGALGAVADVTEIIMAEANRNARLAKNSSSSSSDILTDARNEDCDNLIDDCLDIRPHPLLGLGAVVNLQLAFFNLLPVPILDGGKLLLLALEAVRGGRSLPPLLERSAVLGSLVLLGGWMVVINVRDLVGLTDKAASRLAASLKMEYGTYDIYSDGFFHWRQQQQQQGRLPAARRNRHQEQNESDYSAAAAAAVA